MPDNSSEFGVGPGRTGYHRPLRNYEQLRFEYEKDPSDPDTTVDDMLARELEMEKRDRNVDEGFVIT